MTVFMEIGYQKTIQNGLISIINLPSWMFLSSFLKLRTFFIKKVSIVSLLHLGRGVFGSDFGTVCFCYRNSIHTNSSGVYRTLFETRGKVDTVETKEKLFLDKNFGKFEFEQSNFLKSGPSNRFLGQ